MIGVMNVAHPLDEKADGTSFGVQRIRKEM